MNNNLKAGLVTTSIMAALGLSLYASEARAAIVPHVFSSNAVNYCQAFTPGISNTIRNRVIGSENVGSKIAVACNFHSMDNNTAAPPAVVQMWFSNNNSSTSVDVTCTLLTGFQGDASSYLVTKSTGPIAPGGTSQVDLTWGPADNPAGGTNLGNFLVGINCTLPTGAIMNDAYLVWEQDNGV